MKLRNVISGMRRYYKFEELTIIDTNRVLFSGTLDQWDRSGASDIGMHTLKRETEERDVLRRFVHNNRKAFLFVGNPFDTSEEVSL